MDKKIMALTAEKNDYVTPDAHLCYIVSQGFNITDEQNYLELIVNPNFRCSHCGRRAAHNSNLCIPIKL